MKQDREGEDVPSAPGEQVVMAHVELVRCGNTGHSCSSSGAPSPITNPTWVASDLGTAQGEEAEAVEGV